jgi:hypothetical protein
MNHSTKLSRRKLFLLLSASLLAVTISTPSEAGKKGGGKARSSGRSRTSPIVMIGIGGGMLGAWLIKMNRKVHPPSTTPSVLARKSKPINKSTPEVAEWYVFRSGKAEGPYTALQLWEVQKITARTKVRRGEANWQRAGEIAELAKYLSEK